MGDSVGEVEAIKGSLLSIRGLEMVDVGRGAISIVKLDLDVVYSCLINETDV
jgi:hypothetical protein